MVYRSEYKANHRHSVAPRSDAIGSVGFCGCGTRRMAALKRGEVVRGRGERRPYERPGYHCGELSALNRLAGLRNRNR
jgi:hypothetical protein